MLCDLDKLAAGNSNNTFKVLKTDNDEIHLFWEQTCLYSILVLLPDRWSDPAFFETHFILVRNNSWLYFHTYSQDHHENELLVKLSTVSFSDDLVQGTESKEGLLCLSCWRCLMLASFWVCSFTHSKISLPCWDRNWKCPSPVLQPLKIKEKSDILRSVRMQISF